MNSPIAIALGILIVGGIVGDAVVFGSEHTLFLARKLADLIEWMAFWR